MNIPSVYLPYRFYGFESSVLERKLCKTLATLEIVETDKVIAAWKPLAWDSEHFSLKMLELTYFICSEDATVEDRWLVLERLHRAWQGYQHVTARINAFDIQSVQAFEQHGFQLMDTNMKYGLDFRKAHVTDMVGEAQEIEGVVYEVVRCPCLLPELVELALKSWGFGRVATDRFHADRRLPVDLADSVYTEWIRNELAGRADIVLIPKVNDKAVGFLTLHEQADRVGDVAIGVYVLGCIDPSMRERHIYSRMISVGLQVLKRKAAIAESGTQVTNYPVLKTNFQLGLKLVSTTYVFHKWLKLGNMNDWGKKR